MTCEHLRKLKEMVHKASESLPDEDALEAVELFPVWQTDTDYTAGDRRRDGDRLYKCRQAHHSQPDWSPSTTPALWEEVAKPGDGSHDNPIHYNNNMALENGKYYTQFDVLYLCFRDTGTAVYNDLKDLVGLYVEVVIE